MKDTFIDIPKTIAAIIIVIGWLTGNLDGWIAIPLLLIMSELKYYYK